MKAPQSADKFLMDVMQLSRQSGSPKDLMQKFGDYVKATLLLDEVIVKEPQGSQGLGTEEVALNTGKPYAENGLSEYSASDMIRYYNKGFRSCAVLPVSKDGKAFGTVTLLSKDEKGFGTDLVSLLSVASNLVSAESNAKYESDKSLNVARYFDASFNNMFPQMLVDANGNIMKANKSALNYFDKTQKELSGSRISDIFSLDTVLLEKLRNGMIVESSGKAYPERVFEISPSKVNDNLTHILINEISEMKDAEEKAQFLDNASGEVFVITNPNSEIAWISKSANSLLGVQGELLIGKKFSDFVTDSGTMKEISASQKYSGTIKLNFGNDSDVNAKVISYKSGNYVYFIISRDYDRYVKSMEKRVSEVVALSNDPMIEIDSAGYIRSYNKAAGDLFRFGNENVSSLIYSVCADSESQNRIVASLSIAKSNGYIEDVYVNMMLYDGSQKFPCVQKIKALNDDKGSPSRYLIMIKEMATKRKIEELNSEIERALKEVNKLQEESDLKSQFLYNISHDLKTPITNIMGFSKLLLTDDLGTFTKEQHDYIEIIYKESERFLELVKQILDAAKLSSGIVKLDFQQVNFNEIGENASIKALEEACQNKGLTFEWKVDYDVPIITADPNRLIQVFSNLIGNAIKFTENGGVSVKVSKRGRGALVEVSDTGIGISREDAAKIFKKFYQLRRGLVKQEGSGTGLGLSIAREIVHLHGGSIKLVSEVGKGSTFMFTMPVTPRIKKKTQKYNKPEQQSRNVD